MASYRYERDIKPEDLIPDVPRQLTKQESRANWWHYHWVYVALIAAAVFAIVFFVWQRVREVEPDYIVTVVGCNDPDTAFLEELEQKLTALALDENEDGKVVVWIKSIWLDLYYDGMDAEKRRLMNSSQDKLNADFYLCESAIFIVDDPAGLQERFGCFQRLDGSDPAEDEALAVEEYARPLEDTALAGTLSTPETRWYIARRIAEGAVNEETLRRGDVLWNRL
ncbi:MAG: hypothetical protein ACI4JC_00855 [Faecalibacterium sp.]